mgnify:FL=1
MLERSSIFTYFAVVEAFASHTCNALKAKNKETMNIVEISGSTARQMFQYALYMALLKRDPHTLVNPAGASWIKSRFGQLRYIQATAEQLKPYGMHSRLGRLAARLVRPKGRIVTDPAGGGFDPGVLELDGCYLQGQWLSPRYFAGIEDGVRKAFAVTDRMLPAQSRGLLRSLAKPGCTAMLVSDPQAGGATADFYNWAVANVLSSIGKANFMVFTTDPDWVWANINFQGAEAHTAAYPIANEATVMAYLMRASHCITGPSLNGWWGAWLNPDPDRIVIVPEGWSKTDPKPDLIPRDWTTIPLT